MHINVICPYCKTGYQLQPSLRGQSIKCPNGGCKRIFVVTADPPPPPASTGTPARSSPPDKGSRSSSVGDMVPILPAESATAGPAPSQHVADMVPVVPAEPVAPRPGDGDWWQGAPAAGRQPQARPPAAPPPPATPAAPAGPWWRDAPPPVRNPQAPAESPPAAQPAPAPPANRRRAPEAPVKTPARPAAPSGSGTQQMAQPVEMPAGTWDPPPVRRGPDASATEVVAEGTATHEPPPRKRRSWLLLAPIIILVPLLLLGAGGVFVYLKVIHSEEARSKQAMDEYKQGQYGSSASKFHELAERFPESEHVAEYRFLEQWAGLCSGLTDAAENDLPAAASKLDEFVKEHKKDPLMEKYGHDAGQLVLRMAKLFAERNAAPSGEAPLASAQRLDQLRRTVESLGPDALTRQEGAEIDADLARVRAAVAAWRQRQNVLKQLVARRGEKPFAAIKRVRLLLESKDPAGRPYSEDPEAQAALSRLYDTHAANIVYESRKDEGQEPPGPLQRDDDARSIVFAPLLPSAAPGKAPDHDPIVLALARGVLYALRQSTGELKWATRVGIDTNVLPLRVPASAASPERLLVLSADTQTLTALNTDGGTVWEYHVGQPVLGKPVLVRNRAYLAAYDGWVHEIELSEGGLLGRYPLGQRLTCGGTREGDSDRIYFPADDSCIYVLDIGERRCVNILYDGHPSGSLPSEPVIVPPSGPDAPGYLILNQRSGLDGMQLRVFELPLSGRHAAPLSINPEPRIPGWTWFEPYQDGEKLVVLTDAGTLGLFGIRQLGNKDQALFPLLQPGGLDLSPFLRATGGLPRERGRSQVVQVQGDDLWVLAHGRLQQMQLRWTNATGPRAVAGWSAPRVLGSPLHAPQTLVDRAGRSTFVLVTQPLEEQTCRASAVDEDGRILWQRQLGLVCQGEPLALTPPQGGPPLLLALDQGGGLFVLDPPQPPARPRHSWRSLAPALEVSQHLAPRLLPSPDGHSAYELAAPGDGKNLVVRHIEWAGGARELRVRQREVSLLSAAGGPPLLPQGTPAIVGSQLVVPMADGSLGRVSLPLPEESAHFDSGPDWRSGQAAPSAVSHVLALGGDRFLTTDGRRGLAVWEWPAEQRSKGLPEGRDVLTREMDNFLAMPPLLLPARAGQPTQLLVADSAGVLNLLALANDGSLQDVRKWDLRGRFTAGPFLHHLPNGGVRVGCILDRQQFVWLDSAQAEPLWTYRTDGESIIGQPQFVEDLLVVALQSGRYVGLDPAKGEVKGGGYTLRASAAPASTPVAFGPGQVFAPLSDGTALLLPLQRITQPAPKGEVPDPKRPNDPKRPPADPRRSSPGSGAPADGS